MSSAVPTAKAALLSLAQAALSAFPEVGVTYGAPGQYVTPEAVWLDDVPQFGDESSNGQVSHRETFVIPVVVSILNEGFDHQSAEERAWQIAAPIEDAIRQAPDLNGAVGVTAALVTGKSPDSFGAPGGVCVEITISVTVRSRT